MRKPTTNRVTQSAAAHGYSAVDYSFQPDQWVYAPEAGRITDVTLSAGDCGKRIVLTAGQHRYYMCHFQDVAINMNQRVTQGQKLGIMGETGKAYGRHLHLVIYDNGTRVADPDKWLNARITKEDSMNATTVKKAYRARRGSKGKPPTAKEITLHVTKGTINSLLDGLTVEADKNIAAIRAKDGVQNKAIADLKKALANEKAKAPVEVIKEVERL